MSQPEENKKIYRKIIPKKEEVEKIVVLDPADPRLKVINGFLQAPTGGVANNDSRAKEILRDSELLNSRSDK